MPGVHIPCHADCFAVHPDGRKVFVTGGWHGLGDLSHSLCETAEAAESLMALALSVKDSDSMLYTSLLEEARYGLEWMLYTRFGDGYRCAEHCLDAWTGGIIGDADDAEQPAHNDPYANFCAASASAAAARLYTQEDRIFAQYCLNCAKEDFLFAYERMNLCEKAYGIKKFVPEMQMNGRAMAAAAELYRSTGDDAYLEKAVRFAKVVLDCQQMENTGWTGYFYDSRQKTRLTEDTAAAVAGFALLAECAPLHSDCGRWLAALAAYAKYLRMLAELTQPYGVFSAALTAGGIKRFAGEGFFENMLSKAKNAAVTAATIQDDVLKSLAVRQVEWLLGSNPFSRSFLFGEGHGFQPLFYAFSRDMTGAIPAGLRPSENGEPSLCMTNSEAYNFSGLAAPARLLRTIAGIRGSLPKERSNNQP